MKNFIKLRKLTNIFYFMAFLFSVIALFCINEKTLTIFGVDFYYNKINGMFLFLANFMLYLFNLNSKNSVRYVQKLFYPISLVILILINLILLVDNFFAIFLLLFLLFFANYFLNQSKTLFTKDCITLFISFAFISYGVLRYFALNEIPATLLNILHYQYKIDSLSINFALFGLLLLISKLFNFVPFNLKAKNSFILNFTTMVYLIIGCDLLIKTFILLNYYFYKTQSIISLYIVINVLYYAFMQFRAKGISEFLRLTLSANIAIGIYALFSYGESGLVSFIYYSIAIILSYSAGFLISDIIEKKMQTDDFCALKKINHKNKLIKFFIFIIFLNLAKIPPGAAFCATIYSFLNIFLTDLSGNLISLAPYILFVCAFLLSLNSFNVMGKILIEPQKLLKSFELSLRQKFILSVVCFTLVASGLGVWYIMGQFTNIVDIGNI